MFLSIVIEIIILIIATFIFLTYQTIPTLWLLPTGFAICFPVLFRIAKRPKLSLFYQFFLATSLLRYVVHPLLIAIVGEYSEASLRIDLSIGTLNKSVMLMLYELFVCTLLIYVIWKNESIKQEDTLLRSGTYNGSEELPPRLGLYKLFVGFAVFMLLICPKALTFFSFAFFSFSSLETSSLTVLEQISVIVLIGAKYFAYILVILWCKKRHELAEEGNYWYVILAVTMTLLFGCIYYGSNRLVFVFNFVATVFIYILLFKEFHKLIIVMGCTVATLVIIYLTAFRNYYDYYSGYTGMELLLRNIKSTINAYLGGITNVAVAIETAKDYGEYASMKNLIIDLVSPIVGINKLLPVRNKITSGAYFNYTFFADRSVVSQIIPTIGHGYYYFGFILAPIADIAILAVFYIFERLRTMSHRIEVIYILFVVTMRMAMLYGVNITIINNEISMQVIVPLFVYWLNNKISIKGL